MNIYAHVEPEAIIDIAEADTLSGDIRDALLMHVRSIQVPWAMLAQDEQQAIIDAITKTADHAVRQIARIVATADLPHVLAKVSKFTVKNEIKIELLATSLVANICALAEHGNGNAVLVLADAADFIGERAPAKADPDQPDLLDKQRGS
jgi:hypothetical protein